MTVVSGADFDEAATGLVDLRHASVLISSAWGHQLPVDSAGDPRLQRFVDTSRNSSRYTPEHGSVVDSVPVRTGGRTGGDGGSRVDPAGRVPSS